MTVTYRLPLARPCKLWTGCTDKDGYGRKCHEGCNRFAHRLAYCEAHGLALDDIKGMVIRHKCDVRNCIEPTHLVAGTQADNVQDMVERHRYSHSGGLKGEAHPRHKLTAEQVQAVKTRLAEGRSTRAVAAEFGVQQPCIQKIKSGTRWKHLQVAA
jgi:hypothetical protein